MVVAAGCVSPPIKMTFLETHRHFIKETPKVSLCIRINQGLAVLGPPKSSLCPSHAVASVLHCYAVATSSVFLQWLLLLLSGSLI